VGQSTGISPRLIGEFFDALKLPRHISQFRHLSEFLAELTQCTFGPLAQLEAGIERGTGCSPRAPSGRGRGTREFHDFSTEGIDLRLELGEV
jgi:hypothetical protein